MNAQAFMRKKLRKKKNQVTSKNIKKSTLYYTFHQPISTEGMEIIEQQQSDVSELRVMSNL